MAQLLLDFKEVTHDEIIEVKVWHVPKSKHYPEGINYRMVYVKAGKRIFGYDNNTLPISGPAGRFAYKPSA